MRACSRSAGGNSTRLADQLEARQRSAGRESDRRPPGRVGRRGARDPAPRRGGRRRPSGWVPRPRPPRSGGSAAELTTDPTEAAAYRVACGRGARGGRGATQPAPTDTTTRLAGPTVTRHDRRRPGRSRARRPRTWPRARRDGPGRSGRGARERAVARVAISTASSERQVPALRIVVRRPSQRGLDQQEVGAPRTASTTASLGPVSPV